MFRWKQLREALALDTVDYPVPAHANSFWYFLGSMSIVCFIITFITGAILSQFYDPTPVMAHAAVRYISGTPGLGFIRSLHHWSADLGFALLIVHIFRVIFTGAYRPPRVVTYLVGVGLLFVTFNLYFTGTVIKWDQEGYEALAHFVAVNKLIGPLGAIFQEDFTLSTSMLARIYGLHVAILPVLFILLIALHAFYIKHFGIAPKPYQSEEDYERSMASGVTFAHHLKRTIFYAVILLAILIGMALLFPPGLLEAPKAGIEVTKPPWVFWVFYPIESLLGIAGLMLGSVLLIIYFLLIPLFGLMLHEEKKLYRIVNTMAICGLIAWFALLVITYFSPTMKHL